MQSNGMLASLLEEHRGGRARGSSRTGEARPDYEAKLKALEDARKALASLAPPSSRLVDQPGLGLGAEAFTGVTPRHHHARDAGGSTRDGGAVGGSAKRSARATSTPRVVEASRIEELANTLNMATHELAAMQKHRSSSAQRDPREPGLMNVVQGQLSHLVGRLGNALNKGSIIAQTPLPHQKFGSPPRKGIGSNSAAAAAAAHDTGLAKDQRLPLGGAGGLGRGGQYAGPDSQQQPQQPQPMAASHIMAEMERIRGELAGPGGFSSALASALGSGAGGLGTGSGGGGGAGSGGGGASAWGAPLGGAGGGAGAYPGSRPRTPSLGAGLGPSRPGTAGAAGPGAGAAAAAAAAAAPIAKLGADVQGLQQQLRILEASVARAQGGPRAVVADAAAAVGRWGMELSGAPGGPAGTTAGALPLQRPGSAAGLQQPHQHHHHHHHHQQAAPSAFLERLAAAAGELQGQPGQQQAPQQLQQQPLQQAQEQRPGTAGQPALLQVHQAATAGQGAGAGLGQGRQPLLSVNVNTGPSGSNSANISPRTASGILGVGVREDPLFSPSAAASSAAATAAAVNATATAGLQAAAQALSGVQDSQAERKLLRENQRLRTTVEDLTKECEGLRKYCQQLQSFVPKEAGGGGLLQGAGAANGSSAACGRCTESSAKARELQAELAAARAETTDVRAALQAAREREGQQAAQLAMLQDAISAQNREAAGAISALEAELRAMYATAMHRPASEQPDTATAAAALHKRLRQLVADVESQEAEISRLKAQLARASHLAHQRDFEASATVAEADMARDQAVKLRNEAAKERDEAIAQRDQAIKQHEEARQELEYVQLQHAKEVRGLQQQLHAMQQQAEQAAQQAALRAKQEAEQRLAQLREYVLTLEHKLAAAAGSADEAQGMRQEVIKMHKQLVDLQAKAGSIETLRKQLDAAEEEHRSMQDVLQQREQEVAGLRAELDKLRSQLKEIPGAQKVVAMERDLGLTLQRLEAAAKAQSSLKAELASKSQELEAARGQLASTQQALSEANAALRHSRDHQEALARDPLHPQSQSHTQSHASLHVGAMQAEASGSSLGGGSTLSTGPALSIFNDGSAAGLSHENRVLRERVAALEGQLGSWQDERAAAEQALAQERDAAAHKAAELELRLAHASSTEAGLNSTANALAHDVASLQNELRRKEGELEDARQRAAAGDEASGQLQFLQEAVRDMEAQASSLQAQLRAARAEADAKPGAEQLQALRSELRNAQEQLMLRSSELIDARAAIAQYEEALAGLESELHAAQGALQDAQEARDEAERARGAAVIEVQNMRGTLAAYEAADGPLNQVVQLGQALSQERARVASLAQQVEDMRAQRDQLQVQLEHKIAEAYQLDGTVNILRNELMRYQVGEL